MRNNIRIIISTLLAAALLMGTATIIGSANASAYEESNSASEGITETV